jgi:hypothetical protein
MPGMAPLALQSLGQRHVAACPPLAPTVLVFEQLQLA